TCIWLWNGVGTGTTATPGITLNPPSANYGSLNAGATANGGGYQFRVASSVSCGTQVNFTLTLTSAQGAAVTRTISVVVGQTSTGPPTRYTYTGPPVSIPDDSLTGAVATLMVPGSLVVGDVNLNLDNITQTLIGDLFLRSLSPDAIRLTTVNMISDGT